MEALNLDRVSMSFGGVDVLINLSLSVEQGEHVAIIGPNGAGKTTLLNVISGALLPSTGRISVFGQNITSKPTYDRVHLGLGRSFQITTLFRDLTVLQNVLLALHGTKPSRFQMFRPMSGYKGILTKAKELLQSVDLWDARDEFIRAISYGEQRKIEIILSLAAEPKLLLLDEPTAGLAISEIHPFMRTMKTLATGTAVLLTSHDMDVVFGLADRVVVLYFGKIVVQGRPEEIQINPMVRQIYLGIEDDRANAEAT